ncbi:MAG: mechanosensitive ion channel [Bacteroidota bacterium]|nr:mechanosensitive ion channel [Bacteroidota bacterium]MDP4274165.1 mechanosensitive ion channel [Bacteroidota bacterium]
MKNSHNLWMMKFQYNGNLIRRSVIFVCLFFVFSFSYAQPKGRRMHASGNLPLTNKVHLDSIAKKDSVRKKMILASDTLTMSDYMMSIERINDNLNSINDSARLKFEVVHMRRRIDEMTNDINLIRQNIRDRHEIINIRNLYLYQNFISDLDQENDKFQTHLNKMYSRVYHAKIRLRTALSDSVFKILYTNNLLRNKFDRKLIRLERKWFRTDSITKSNVDTLNALKVKVADNSVNLSNMINMMDRRLDRSRMQLFGPEFNCLWQFDQRGGMIMGKGTPPPPQKVASMMESEQKAIGYYISQTSQQRTFILILGVVLFIWLFFRRKLLRLLKTKEGMFSFLHIRYLNSHPVSSLFVFLLCLMPLFDAYAPTSYISIEFSLLVISASIIFFRTEDRLFLKDWMTLIALFVAETLTYLLARPAFLPRIWMLILDVGIIFFSYRFYNDFGKQRAHHKWIRRTSIVGIILAALGFITNLFGRFSLSGILSVSAIFAIVQAIILPVFVETFVEIILLQLQSSRLKKGVEKPFDCSFVVNKIKATLVIVALILWLIMLTSNLNIYHFMSNGVISFLDSPRIIGSISFKWISVLLFFVIIWLAHLLQRMVSFLFGETGSEAEDTSISKQQHSRLLVTRLLVILAGYLLAIVASGLPIDKLTFLLGALGVGIGMGLQNVVNNFVSGIILIFDGSLKIGDEIEISGQSGKVKEIGLRASRLNTADGAEVIIPNGNILSQNIVNWTFSNDQKRVIVQFTLIDRELDANVINEVINETIKDIPDVIAQRKPVILYTKVAKENCSITVRFWSTIAHADLVKSETMLRLQAAFTAKGMGFE